MTQQHTAAAGAALSTSGVVALLRLAVLSVDPEGHISYWNRGAEELFGHRWENVFGRPASGLLPGAPVPLPAQLPAGPRPHGDHHHGDALDRLDDLTRDGWAGAMPVTDRDGGTRDALWWSYRLIEPAGRSLLVLAANAKPLRALGPRLALGDHLLPYSAEERAGREELCVTAGLARVDDPVLADDLGGRLGAVLPRVSPLRLDRIMRQVVPLGYPVLGVDGAGPLAVLPHDGAAARRHHPRQPADPARPRRRRELPPGALLGTGPAVPAPTVPVPAVLSPAVLTPAVLSPPTGGSLSDRLALLREAGARVGTTLDLATTARELCEIAVPRFADAAGVHIVDSLFNDGEPPKDPAKDGHAEGTTVLRRLAAAFREGTGAWSQLAPEGELLTPPPSAAWGRIGDPLLVPTVDPAIADDVARDLGIPALGPLLDERSLLVVPLMARGTVLGRMVLTRHAHRLPFDAKDAATAEELAARGALCLDNARLHLQESRAATTLQRSMLPTRPPKLPGVWIAFRYRPGDRQAQVGGDWFDAVQLPGGRVALIVGDVMGHGLHSAAVMGQFRTAVQTMAALDLPPAQLLRHLDNLAHRLGQDHLATCVYAVYDPVHRTLTLANAGHVPPVLAPPDGPSELLQVPEGAPIGVGGVPFETVEIPVPDGSWLILCTDGLVEVRDEGGIGAGLAALCDYVMEPHQTPDEVCDAILGRLHSEDRSDDVALLVAKFAGIPSEDVAEWHLPLDFAEVRRARALTRKQLAEWGLGTLADLTELLVSELITNALRHANHSVELRLMRVDKLMVEVSDDDHNLPRLRRADAEDEDGRGLALVSNLSQRWGTNRKAVGKVVWFELPLPHPDH